MTESDHDFGPLPASVSEYTIDHRAATPDDVLDACNLPEARRPQVEYYLADTRYTMFKHVEGNDAEDLRWDTVEWADVADWTIPESDGERTN